MSARTPFAWIAGCLGVAVVVGLTGCTSESDVSRMSYPQTPEDSMPYGQEEYDRSAESPFVDAATTPLSTFSADVDTASYSNMRRQVRMGMKPDGVRVEELVNYFDYSYLAPDRDAAHPFSVTTEVAAAPWNSEHQLAMIGVQATRAVPTTAGNNIVFLIDVSGSMEAADKLPLLKDSFGLLVDKLGPQDVVSIVTYAGSDTIAADSVRGSDHARLKAILKDLTAGGSTAGAKGLTTAYTLATNNFITGGNNRVILATDGDFNVGQSSDEAMLELIEEKRASGVYISVLGFGMGNLKDRKMETIADHGNGNYAYIDTLNEAKKVLVDEFDSTMFVVAQDLKLQVEFNADVVSQYRLIGYDNRRLDDEDFADDTKDAGDVGAGHSVTAFYEIIPVSATTSGDYMTVSVRYKKPGQTESALTTTTVTSAAWTTTPSEDFAFASAVVEFGLVASDSQYAGNATARHAAQQAKGALGDDPYNLRSEFVELVGLYTEIVG